MKNSTKKKEWIDFEDKFLLHQYCKIERRSKPNPIYIYIYQQKKFKSLELIVK